MPGKHATLAPSAASRWILCPASVAMSAGIEQGTSFYAAEGTAAHELAAKALTEGNSAHDYIGDVIEGFEVDDTMAAHVQRYIDKLDVCDAAWIEEWLDVPDVPGVSGTPDFVAVDTLCDLVEVNDLKYGQGVKVYAVENEQLMLYGLGAMRKAEGVGYEVSTIRLCIHQPRLNHYDEWEISRVDLEAFAERARASAATAQAILDGTELLPDDAFMPCDQACRFCPAKAICPALHEANEAAVRGELFDDIEPEPAHTPRSLETMSNDQLAELMPHLDRIEGWCKAVREHVAAEMQKGHPVPGYKLVEGRKGARQWSDEAEAERILRKTFRLRQDDCYSKKLISPTQAEKQLSRQRFGKLSSLITQGGGKPAVAPESDKRPAISAVADASEFSIDENQE